MRTHPHLVPRRYPDSDYCNEAVLGEPAPMDMGGGAAPAASKKHKRCGSAKSKHHHSQQLQLQRSFSSSDDELRSTPDCGSCDERDPDKGMSAPLALSSVFVRVVEGYSLTNTNIYINRK